MKNPWKEATKWKRLARDREEIIKMLLRAADCSWEERNEGHDWARAAQRARGHLLSDPDAP